MRRQLERVHLVHRADYTFDGPTEVDPELEVEFELVLLVPLLVLEERVQFFREVVLLYFLGLVDVGLDLEQADQAHVDLVVDLEGVDQLHRVRLLVDQDFVVGDLPHEKLGVAEVLAHNALHGVDPLVDDVAERVGEDDDLLVQRFHEFAEVHDLTHCEDPDHFLAPLYQVQRLVLCKLRYDLRTLLPLCERQQPPDSKYFILEKLDFVVFVENVFLKLVLGH
eukprot:CAMPEP_0116974064 /NCGR_PEP_ID=MMETSP0467-20121206/54916_1 /TAXON_ID=283647 /ORGANISM="Mesodinium pulex, Strain SPMC105" /LENGTH=222 /DNA_ID=CAMNT_0004666077 /DNA_START=638 /DNA_END=1306 /DNA_ORIENTATION=+